ncbi:hypothetical protein BN59_00351 [Legionella massiliensis]|uniref:Uncharacterized protein n=1 Tax=Legionella massiliensis TaxID=1034943 RepID=A0A078KT01_9GAMM|nr:hypothetical protein [Legionella massiliensis]CDZ76087.1 hypothetical protein BN59_00351 [Legionella massiliensis]CEE11825.1 hypothetical protein BN1094_00351 [Legionella massiliensis]
MPSSEQQSEHSQQEDKVLETREDLKFPHDLDTQPTQTEPLQPSTQSSSSSSYIWTVLGSGSYNKVWRSDFSEPMPLVLGESYPGPWVLKYPIPSGDSVTNAMNSSERAVRVWNEINSQSLPKAGYYKKGWVAPYITNTRPATDNEIALKLIDIFCKQRRIVIDAAIKGNFLTRNDTGEVLLVDVDLALKRSNSLASIDFAKMLDRRTAHYWSDPLLQQEKPKTLEITKNLLYLEDQFDSPLIDELCKQGLLTLKNIQALTWLSVNRLPLTPSLFQKIATLNNDEIEVTDILLRTLYKIEQASQRTKFISGVTSIQFFPMTTSSVDENMEKPESAVINHPKK